MSQNPYQSSDYNYPSMMADVASADARATFLKRTYLHLLGAILACAAIDAIILTVFADQLAPVVGMVSRGWNWLIVLGAFMGISYVAERWAMSNVSKQKQYLGLGVYVLAQALILIPLLFLAQMVAPGAIQSAGLVTAIVFGGLTLTVLVTKADFSFLKWGLVAGGFIAAGLIVVAILTGSVSLGLWFSIAMVVLACGSILYNTSNVLHRYNTEQYVAASLSLFASIALLFWYVLQIFMSLRD